MWRGANYVPTFAWRGGGKPRKTSGNVACVAFEIRTGRFGRDFGCIMVKPDWLRSPHRHGGYNRLQSLKLRERFLVIFSETHLIYSERL